MFKAKMPNLDFKLIIFGFGTVWQTKPAIWKCHLRFSNLRFEQVMNPWIKKNNDQINWHWKRILNGFVNASWCSLMKGTFASFRLAFSWTLKHLSRVWSHLFIQKDLVKKKKKKGSKTVGAVVLLFLELVWYPALYMLNKTVAGLYFNPLHQHSVLHTRYCLPLCVITFFFVFFCCIFSSDDKHPEPGIGAARSATGTLAY